LIRELRQACEEFGFFQLVNHGIPSDLQDSILAQSKKYFDLPIQVKEGYSKGNISTYDPTSRKTKGRKRRKKSAKAKYSNVTK
jgi:isopenicillin N synthase-like dioxygenase